MKENYFNSMDKLTHFLNVRLHARKNITFNQRDADWGGGSTRVQAGEFAAFFGILTEVLATLWSLTQCSHTHLRLAIMTRAAQTRIVPLRGEVVTLIHNIVFYIHTRLPWEGNPTEIQSNNMTESKKILLQGEMNILLLQRKGNFL